MKIIPLKKEHLTPQILIELIAEDSQEFISVHMIARTKNGEMKVYASDLKGFQHAAFVFQDLALKQLNGMIDKG